MDTISEYFDEGFTQTNKFVLAEEAIYKFLKGRFALETIDFYKNVLTQNPKKQSQLGQFHTPKEVVNIVLDCLPSSLEADLLSGAKLLDPSCGTGIFLITIIERLIHYLNLKGVNEPHKVINKKIIPNILGIEIDSTLVEATKKIFKLKFEGKIKAPKIICDDALLKNNKKIYNLLGKFDYVVGNPPWVEVKVLPDSIKKYIQNEYSVSNLYGAFILRSFDFLAPGGYISYVVPRSFTGGRYFYKLRKYLLEKKTLKTISYYKKRNQNFHGGTVLQEMVIISLKNSNSKNAKKVTCVPCYSFSDFKSSKKFKVPIKDIVSRHDLILLLADSSENLKQINRITSYKNFNEHGFRFSTGQLVVHRSKNFLCEKNIPGSYRIIYPHNILNMDSNYFFSKKVQKESRKKIFAKTIGIPNFDGRNKNKEKARNQISIESSCNSFTEIIIMRRRSHKGDKRRFIGAYITKDLPTHFFLDNGLNFIVNDKKNKRSPSLKSLSRILRSDLFEKFFETVSSNTQINKNDMYLFGIPEVNELNIDIYKRLEATDFNKVKEITKLVNHLYL